MTAAISSRGFRRRLRAGLASVALALMIGTAPLSAAEPAGPPITIGCSMALTGGLAANGKMALLGFQLWIEDVNARGGLLGRPVKLVYYDDQSSPPLVPGIYTKLIDVDKVDFIVSPYSTNMTAPVLPIAIQRDKMLMGLFALDVNAEFKYPKYFAMLPTGPDTRPALTEGFFEILKANKEKLGLKTIALAVNDGEATRNAADGAMENLKKVGLDVVYNRTYPPSTTDLTPIVRSIQATNADVVFIAAYPTDSVGMIRTVHELGLKTKVFGGAMTGPQTTSLKMQLGPMLNGAFTFDFWLPAPALRFPGVMELLQRYQAKAAGEGIDPLGYYLAPWAYSDLQILGEAIAATGSLDQDKVADFVRTHSFKTLVGEVRFGDKGEWVKSRMLTVQFQDIKSSTVDEFVDGKGEVVVWPPQYAAGEPKFPYSDIKH